MTPRSMTSTISARILFAVFLGVASSCMSPLAPLPDKAERFDAPSVYASWWAMTEACSALTGDLGSVRWYVVPGVSSVRLEDGSAVAGYWQARTRRIVLAGESQYQGDIIRHEMLHALLGSAKGHPRSAFREQCAGVVPCTDRCVADGGPPAPLGPATMTVVPADLEIGIDVTPTIPGSAVQGGHFTMVISVTNARSEPVMVLLPPSGDAGPPASFSYRITSGSSGAWYDMRAETPEVSRFAAGEVKRFVFDFRNVGGPTRYDVAPGTYEFRGAYGSAWSAMSSTVTVLP